MKHLKKKKGLKNHHEWKLLHGKASNDLASPKKFYDTQILLAAQQDWCVELIQLKVAHYSHYIPKISCGTWTSFSKFSKIRTERKKKKIYIYIYSSNRRFPWTLSSQFLVAPGRLGFINLGWCMDTLQGTSPYSTKREVRKIIDSNMPARWGYVGSQDAMILSSIIWLDLCTFRPRSTYIHTSWIQLVGVHLHRDVDIFVVYSCKWIFGE